MKNKFVKICGLTNYEDALTAYRLGADYLGFILVPGAKRAVDRGEFEKIDFGKKVGVFVDAPLDFVLSFKLDVIQLHGSESGEYIEALRAKTSAEIWKALPVVDEKSFEFAKDNYKDLTLLVDGEKGGRPCDRALAAELGKTRPVILAGGLTPENVAEAVRLVKPIGVDTASGVEAFGDPRKKDENKIKTFIEEARKNL